MSKKNRFSMLEIKGEKLPSQVAEPSKTVHEDHKRPKDFKIVVEKDEFKKNLEKHKSMEKIEVIEKQKIELNLHFKTLKRDAYIKIALGILIITLVLNKYLFSTYSGEGIVQNADGSADNIVIRNISQMTKSNYLILGIIAIFFIYLYITENKKGKK